MTQTLPSVDHGHVQFLPVYFDDLDRMGLLHNVRYAVLLERALTTFWAGQDRTDSVQAGEGDLFSQPDAFLAVAEFSITYRAPVRGAGPVAVHLWVERLGTSSAVYGFRFLSPDGATVHAEGRRVHIRLDPDTFRPTPWGDETRAIFETLMS